MGRSGPHLLTAEMLQILLAARDRPPQNSYPKLWDSEPFEGEKVKFKTFLAPSAKNLILTGATGASEAYRSTGSEI